MTSRATLRRRWRPRKVAPAKPQHEPTVLRSILAISLGASLGALLRWWLGLALNSLFPTIPPGTLVANLVGGYLVGLAIAFFATYTAIAPEWRLLVITGFCGGLTTFSTFSAESVELLMAGRYGAAAIHSGAHLFGSVVATTLGIVTFRAIA